MSYSPSRISSLLPKLLRGAFVEGSLRLRVGYVDIGVSQSGGPRDPRNIWGYERASKVSGKTSTWRVRGTE